VQLAECKLPHDEERYDMTGLGAAIYAGFFGLAALWLFMTSEPGSDRND
jgi:hypothetical protein